MCCNRPPVDRSFDFFPRGRKVGCRLWGLATPPSPPGESIMRKHGTQLEHWLANSWPTSHEYSWIISGRRPRAINATNTNCPADWWRTFDYLGAFLPIPSNNNFNNLTKYFNCRRSNDPEEKENWLVNRPANYSNEMQMNLVITTGCYWLWTLNAARQFILVSRDLHGAHTWVSVNWTP